jgi:hypothetical protein
MKKITLQAGHLMPCTCMQILFQPRAAMDYKASAELSARLATEEEPLRILTLEFCGTGRHPRLVFDCSHVVLPAVPLGVYSSRTFRVVNDGYDNLDIQFRLPADTQNVPLELKFPEGTMVGIAKASVPAVVLFKASRPTSFTANIEFMDEDGVFQCPVALLNIEPLGLELGVSKAWKSQSNLG